MLAIGGAAWVTLAAPSVASPLQDTQIQDDRLLVFGTDVQVARGLDLARELGADRIRVTLKWAQVAPRPLQRARPAFDATNHAAYGEAAWRPFDRVARMAATHGLTITFNVSAPGPEWAMRRVRRRDLRPVYAPSAREFGRFVRAVGARYSGTVPGVPRVRSWSIWNEPNQAAWLAPQWVHRSRGRWIERAPARYRALVDLAWAALGFSGHGGDEILIGELAPSGSDRPGRTRPMRPRRFLRALYCVDSRRRPLRGRSASLRGCPPRGARRDFVRAHPALFSAAGFAHHPYSLLRSPGRRSPARDDVALADLHRLAADLRSILARYRVRRPRVPIYLTEYGYQTNPPDRFAGVSFARQAAWLDEATYRAYRRADVARHSQFLIYDDPPDRTQPSRSPRYWSTFQTGLIGLDGHTKPAFSAFRLPIHIPGRVKSAGRPFRIFGQVRVAPPTPRQPVAIEWAPRGGQFRQIATATTNGAPAFFEARIALPRGPGQARLAWTDAGTGRVVRSRHVNVRVR